MSKKSQHAAAAPPTATVTAPVKAPQQNKPKPLPLFRVILHNDDKNTFEHVVTTILSLTPLKEQDALLRTKEAHDSGCALLLVTHKERAELYQEQFQSASLVVTIEPTE